MINKELAKWLPKTTTLIWQLLVSAQSFITLPFFKPHRDGIQVFFEKNYYIKPDGLVFDGSTQGYYSKIKKTFNIKNLSSCNIIDLGCGQGKLYNWLNEEGVANFNYIGLDFAIRDVKISDNSSLINDNLDNIGDYINDSKYMVFMCNTLCYITDAKFNKILHELKTGDELIIIDPSPNLFWDAHFNGVKPIYRKIDEIFLFLSRGSFKVSNATQDYFIKAGNRFIFPISYCIHAVKH